MHSLTGCRRVCCRGESPNAFESAYNADGHPASVGGGSLFGTLVPVHTRGSGPSPAPTNSRLVRRRVRVCAALPRTFKPVHCARTRGRVGDFEQISAISRSVGARTRASALRLTFSTCLNSLEPILDRESLGTVDRDASANGNVCPHTGRLRFARQHGKARRSSEGASRGRRG